MSRVFVLLAIAAGIIGCGGGEDRIETVPAKGTLSIDGKPFGPAKLVFTPTGEPANRPTIGAQVADDGSFAATTYGDEDGAPPGKYQVSISTTDYMTDPALMGKTPPVTTAPAEVEVPSGGTSDLKVDLKATKRAAPRGGPPRPLGT